MASECRKANPGSFDGHRFPRLAYCYVNDFGMCNTHRFVWLLASHRIYGDPDGDGSCSDPEEFRVEAHQITHENRSDEFHFMHSDGRQVLARVLMCLHRSRLIDITEVDSAENRSLRVRFARHHYHSDGGLG